jgi:hypothetical protein
MQATLQDSDDTGSKDYLHPEIQKVSNEGEMVAPFCLFLFELLSAMNDLHTL